MDTQASDVASDKDDGGNKLDAFSSKLKLVYLCGFLFFLMQAILIIPLAAKINLVKNGDIDSTSSDGSFLAFTIFFLKNITQFLLVKYTATLSDYVGRKVTLYIFSLK